MQEAHETRVHIYLWQILVRDGDTTSAFIICIARPSLTNTALAKRPFPYWIDAWRNYPYPCYPNSALADFVWISLAVD